VSNREEASPVTLIDRFVREQSNEIEYDGQRVHSAYVLREVPDGATIRILRLASRLEPVQGIQVHSKQGSLVAAHQAARHLIFWADTAPEVVEVQVVAKPRGARVDVYLRNSWRARFGGVCSSLGNAGIVVEQGDQSQVILRCSDGEGAPVFDDLVVAVEVHQPDGADGAAR
jgi:hypothetical protein